MEAACEILTSKQCTKCLVCLEMVDVRLEARPEEVIANEALRTQLLNTLKDENNEVVERDLKVLVKYVESSKDLPSLIKQIVEVGWIRRRDEIAMELNHRCWNKTGNSWKNEAI